MDILGIPKVYHHLVKFTRMWEGFRRGHQICRWGLLGGCLTVKN